MSLKKKKKQKKNAKRAEELDADIKAVEAHLKAEREAEIFQISKDIIHDIIGTVDEDGLIDLLKPPEDALYDTEDDDEGFYDDEEEEPPSPVSRGVSTKASALTTEPAGDAELTLTGAIKKTPGRKPSTDPAVIARRQKRMEKEEARIKETALRKALEEEAKEKGAAKTTRAKSKTRE